MPKFLLKSAPERMRFSAYDVVKRQRFTQIVTLKVQKKLEAGL